jgi:hypothetical protein
MAEARVVACTESPLSFEKGILEIAFMAVIPFANWAVSEVGASSSRGLDAIRDQRRVSFEDYFHQIAGFHCPVG